MTQYRQKGPRRAREWERRPSLPSGYLSRGYFDDSGNVLHEVIQEWPEQLARAFKDTSMSSTQLRRFFNRARAIEQQNLPFDRLKEEILSLKPVAAASVSRGTAPDIFKQFIDRNTELAISSYDSFKRGFLMHFQSVVAYLKYHEKFSKGGRR